MNVNEKIHIENHNILWKNDYSNEVKCLTQKDSLTDLEYEHIGSTSIPEIEQSQLLILLWE